jgi:hypothetical protein
VVLEDRFEALIWIKTKAEIVGGMLIHGLISRDRYTILETGIPTDPPFSFQTTYQNF